MPQQLFRAVTAQSGQGLSEYVLISACVLVLAIPAFIFLGNSVENVTANMLNHTNNTSSASSTNFPDSSNHISTSKNTLQMSLNQEQGIKLTLADSTSLHLPNYPSDIAKTITTLGANGTTKLLADSLSAVIQQLQDKGEISPEQYNRLMALANQGHRIALIEEIYEKQMEESNYNGTKANQAMVTFEGKQIQLGKLVDRIGWLPSGQGFRPEAGTFNNLYKKAMADGSLKDPVARQTITILKDQILNIANGVETAANPTFSDAATSASKMAKLQLEWLQEIDDETGSRTQHSLTSLASTTTHQGSAHICTAGKFQDSGTRCTQ